MEMKGFLKRIIIIAIGGVVIMSLFTVFRGKKNVVEKDGVVECNAKTVGKDILVRNNGSLKGFFAKGVNIGGANPGSFPNEFSTTKDEYKRWFSQIEEMNANVIRTYTILSPDFYEALYEFNKGKENPLYIIHGIGINDKNVKKSMNAYDENTIKNMKKDIENLIDVIHGNGNIKGSSIHKSGYYDYDISKYVIGLIIGIEWEPDFVYETNLLNNRLNSYNGEYLELQGGQAFEVFLAEMGDYAIKYETEEYEEQRLIGFANWPPTDLLKARNQSLENDNIVNIDVRNIKAKEGFISGMFAPYNIYPSYPNLLNTEKRFIEYKDNEGKINPYRAYLKEVNEHHDIPVMITEFGVPSSRGISDIDAIRGFNKGNLSETKQAEITAVLYKDIVEAGMEGAFVLSWQDEWFKSSWNSTNRVDKESTPYWANAQANEQSYGIMAFDPGKEVFSYPDDSIEEWKDIKPIVESDNLNLYLNSDEKYLYLMANLKGFDKSKDSIYIPIDVTPNSGSKKSSKLGLEFDKETDFIVEIKPNGNSRMYTHDYYDYLRYIDDSLPNINKDMKSNMDSFSPIYQRIMEEYYMEGYKNKANVSMKDKLFESGKLVLGNGNPESKEYNSLTDYSVNGENIEIRIPWQLLNFYDPSKVIVIGDHYKSKEAEPIKISNINVGIGSNKINNIKMKSYKLKGWDKPKYNERLKPLYYKLQQVFKED